MFWSTAVEDILPWMAPSKTTAGANPQDPIQRAVKRESFPSEVVSPGFIPTSFSTAFSMFVDPAM